MMGQARRCTIICVSRNTNLASKTALLGCTELQVPVPVNYVTNCKISDQYRELGRAIRRRRRAGVKFARRG